jgi:hypothetical protein
MPKLKGAEFCAPTGKPQRESPASRMRLSAQRQPIRLLCIILDGFWLRNKPILHLHHDT